MVDQLGTQSVACISLNHLDDAALQLAIDRQEEMISVTPSMGPILEPALVQYRAERDLRLNAKIGTILGDCFVNEKGEIAASTPSNTKGTAPGSKRIYTTPIKTPTLAKARGKRVRFEPDHFDNQTKPLAVEADALKRQKGPSLHEKMRKYPEFRVLMDQFEQNKLTIKHNAANLACPLLVMDEKAKGDYNENDADFMLRTQMKQVAVADDGHEYDFDRIKAYIRQHMDSALLSPVTGEPMTGQVYFTEPVKDRTGQIIYRGKGVDRVPRVIVRAWQPTLNLPKRPV